MVENQAEEMPDENANDQALFMALVFSLHAAGMQQLGKVMNPMSGEIERNLEQAQGTSNVSLHHRSARRQQSVESVQGVAQPEP